MDQVFDEIGSLMDDRLYAKKTAGMGCGFEGGQDDKDFTKTEVKEQYLPYDPEGVEALEFSESDLDVYASQDLGALPEEAPAPEVPAEVGAL